MNRVQSILFLLTFSLTSIASPACPANGHVSGTEAAEGLASIINNIEGEFEPDNEMASFVCASYYSSLSAEKPMNYLESNIMIKLGLDENHPDRKKIIGKFLNENHNKIICGKDNLGRLRDREPLLKRSIGRGEFGLIETLMLEEEEYMYNLNHFEIVDGKKETILDYIEKILNNPELLSKYNAAKIRVIHNDFIEYEAKRGIDL
jgi:hypothetical protein